MRLVDAGVLLDAVTTDFDRFAGVRRLAPPKVAGALAARACGPNERKDQR